MDDKTYLSTKPFRCCRVRDPVIPQYKAGSPDSCRNRPLYQVGEVDIREMIQSNYVSSFDYILDRFLDSGGEYDDLLTGQGLSDNQDFLIDALDLSSEYVEMMEEARELYGLSPDLSYSQIRDELQNILSKGGATNESTKSTQVSENENSSSSRNEQTSESPSVSDDGSSDSVSKS